MEGIASGEISTGDSGSSQRLDMGCPDSRGNVPVVPGCLPGAGSSFSPQEALG